MLSHNYKFTFLTLQRTILLLSVGMLSLIRKKEKRRFKPVVILPQLVFFKLTFCVSALHICSLGLLNNYFIPSTVQRQTFRALSSNPGF